MEAYHSDADLKGQTVALVRWHREQDKIVQGSYWQNGRGCAVGCTLASLAKITHKCVDRSDHAAYETLIGVPQLLARLQDGIFEGLPIEDAVLFPEQFLAAIRPGADLSGVWPRFAVWLLADEAHGVIRHARNNKSRAAIQRVADLYKQTVEGVVIERGTWVEARRSVAVAATYVGDDATTYATYAAADAAAYAAAYAAADARQQAKWEARRAQRDMLLKLLSEAE